MSFSEIIEQNFVLVAKELAQLGSGKVQFKSQETKDVNIDGTYGANCALITIEDKTQLAITQSGDAFIRISEAGKWGLWSRVIRDNDPTLGMMHADNLTNNKPTLEIKGNVRVEKLEDKNWIKTQKLEDLSPVVSDKKGNLFSLPYGRNEGEDHFIIPILRSGLKSLRKGEKMTIKNLFDPVGKYRWGGKHLIEIKLLINHKKSQGAVIVYYIDSKLHNVHVLGDINAVEQIKDELLNFEDHEFTLEIVKNQGNDDERDILIKYSGGYWINIRYFITRYSTN